MSDLDEVLNGEAEETEEAEETPQGEESEEAETEETQGDEEESEETEGEKPDEESEEAEEEDEPPSSEDQDAQEPDTVPIKALQDERRKRQELQERLEALERQGNASEQETKDFWDDPEAHLQGMERKFHDALLNERINISESFARKRWDDLDDRLESFKEMIEQTPSLRDEMLKHPSPWEFVGEQVERQRKLAEFDSAEDYRKQLDADFSKRVEAEAKKRAEKMVAERLEKSESLPGSAADARQAAGRSESDSDADAAPPTLEEALGKP